MANRHANKQLRAAARARMAATGESYQRALAALHAKRPSQARVPQVDVIACECFGVPVTLTLAAFGAGDAATVLWLSRPAAAREPISMRILSARGTN